MKGAVLEQLKNGTAQFELVLFPLRSIATTNSHHVRHHFSETTAPVLCQNSIGSRGSHATKKVECYYIQRITGDGRCLFRALVKGMAFNKGISLSPREERGDAVMHARVANDRCSCQADTCLIDELRMAVKEDICDNDKERHQYAAVLIAITVEESLNVTANALEDLISWGESRSYCIQGVDGALVSLP